MTQTAEWVQEMFCKPCKTERPFTVMASSSGTRAFCDYCDNPVAVDEVVDTDSYEDHNDLSYDGGGYE